MKFTLLLLTVVFSAFAYSQKDGHYLSDHDPVCELWQIIGNEDEDKEGAPMAGVPQIFFFLQPDGLNRSMMAPYKPDGMNIACPTYFIVSKDFDSLYIEIVGQPCIVDLPQEDRYFSIEYVLTMKNTQLWLIIDGVTYKYKPWKR